MSKVKQQLDPEALRLRIKEFRFVKQGEVFHNPKNFRRHPDFQREALRGLLKEIGIAGVALAYYSERNGGKLTFVDGHLRDEEIKENLPVAITDLNDSEADLLLAGYDELSRLAEADKVALDSLLRDVSTGDAAVMELLADLAAESGLEYGSEPENTTSGDVREIIDKAEVLREKWNTNTGQIWQVGRHTVACGDSLDREFVSSVLLHRVDGVCTDPPYELPAQPVRDVLEVYSDIAVVLCADSLAFELTRFWDFRLDFIWHHRKSRSFPTDHMPNFHHNHCMVIARSKRVKTGWSRPRPDFSSVIQCETEYVDTEMGHGKSIELFEAMLSGFAWQSVADPFLVTGATLLACEKQGRTCYGVELNPATLAVALERFERAGLESNCVEGPGADSRNRAVETAANPS